MKHFYCDLHVQHLNLHKNWHISFLPVAKSEILYISVIGTLTSQENGSTKIILVVDLYLRCYLFNVLKLSSNPLSSHPAVEC